MVIVCRRCGRFHEGELEACFAWRADHVCMVKDRPSIAQRLMARVRDDYEHGDWRRFRSRTQHCGCETCHAAWLDHEYDNRF